MKYKINQIAPWVSAGILMSGALVYITCSSAQNDYQVSARRLGELRRLQIDDLTPDETKRLDAVINKEVSPCGDNLSLGQTLLNPEGCPLAAPAASYILDLIKQDYNEDEISERYLKRYASIQGLRIPLDGSPRMGPEKAAVTLVIFTDFECPFCARAAGIVEALTRSYPEHVALVFKNFPIESHPSAELAARAGYAAHRQGKFWEMHDILFSAQGSAIDGDRVQTMAAGLGLDVETFEEDLISDGATASIQADLELGRELGVNGTPFIFVNGRPLEGRIDTLEERIQEEFLRQEYARK